jgi:hypothetical protein
MRLVEFVDERSLALVPQAQVVEVDGEPGVVTRPLVRVAQPLDELNRAGDSGTYRRRR